MSEYTLVFVIVVGGATVIGAYVIVFALGLMADRAAEYRENVEVEVKAEHRKQCERESKRQLDDFFIEIDEAAAAAQLEELEHVYALAAREPIR